jgi:hypothetical protein
VVGEVGGFDRAELRLVKGGKWERKMEGVLKTFENLIKS